MILRLPKIGDIWVQHSNKFEILKLDNIIRMKINENLSEMTTSPVKYIYGWMENGFRPGK